MENDRVGVKVFCVLAVGLCLFYFTQLTLSAAELRWTNSPGGDWANPSNWDPNVTPTSADDIYITGTNDYTVTINGPAEAGRVFLGSTNGVQTLSITSGYLATSQLFQSIRNGVLELNSAELRATGLVHIAGTVIATNGTNGILGTAPVTIEPTGEVITSDFHLSQSGLSSPRQWTNHGRIVCRAGILKANANTALANEPDGVIDLEDVAEVDCVASRSLSVINSGQIRKVSGTNLVNMGRLGVVSLVNLGLVELSGGGVKFNAGDQFTQNRGIITLSNATIQTPVLPVAMNAGFLKGSGTIIGSLSQQAGIVRPQGILSISGGYQLKEDAQLFVTIGGLDPGAGLDQMVVGGQAVLAGLITVCMANNFVPVVGQQFPIVRYSSRAQSPIFSGLCAKDVDFHSEPTSTNVLLTAIVAAPGDGPSIKMFKAEAQHLLCWPTGYPVSLETTPHLTPAAWTKVSLTESNSYMFETTEPSRFFRLASE